MEYKAAFFDVDSTLTAGINQPVVESAVDAIRQLRNKGIKIVIASGRMPYGLENIKGKIQADFFNCANGQFVCDNNMNVIDAGIPVLNMHSPMEIVSKADVYEAYKAYVAFIKFM